MHRERGRAGRVPACASACELGLLLALALLLAVHCGPAVAQPAGGDGPVLSLSPPPARLVGPGSGLELVWTITSRSDTVCIVTLEFTSSRSWPLSMTIRGIEVQPNASARFLLPSTVPDSAAAGQVPVFARMHLDGDKTTLDSCGTVLSVMNAPAAGTPVVLASDLVLVEWSTALRGGDRGIVEVQRNGQGWGPEGAVTADEAGRCTFEDHRVTPGGTVDYRLRTTVNSLTMVSAVTTVHVPERTPLRLAGLRPNPSGASATVAFTLPERAPTQLDIYDLAGRRVLSRDLGVLAPGSHLQPIGAHGALRPGLYVFRITAGGRSASTRGVIAR